MQHALPSGHTHLVLQHLITTIQIMQHVLPSGHTHLVLQNLIIKITHKDYQSKQAIISHFLIWTLYS